MLFVPTAITKNNANSSNVYTLQWAGRNTYLVQVELDCMIPALSISELLVSDFPFFCGLIFSLFFFADIAPLAETESGGPQDPYSDASAKYGPLKLPQLQNVDLNKMYGGAAQVRRNHCHAPGIDSSAHDR